MALKQDRAQPLWVALEKIILYISISISIYIYTVYIYIGLTLTSLSLRRYAAFKQDMYIDIYLYLYCMHIYTSG